MKWTQSGGVHSVDVIGAFRLSVYEIDGVWHASLLDVKVGGYLFQTRELDAMSEHGAKTTAKNMARLAIAKRIEEHGKALARLR